MLKWTVKRLTTNITCQVNSNIEMHILELKSNSYYGIL